MDSKKIEFMKLDILAFAAHPDDIEISCSGTLLKHIAMGKTVGIIDLTRGEMGTRGNANIRQQETHEASQILGIQHRENLGFKDVFFEHEKEHMLEIVRVIRKYRPEIVLANSTSDRHPDHGRASKLVSDASFYAGLSKIITSDQEISQNHWRPANVYFYVQDYLHKPDFIVDITAYMDQKMDAMLAFKSQFYDPNSTEPDTPISSAAFLEFITARARDLGRISGVDFAEGFLIQRPLEVKDLFSLK